MNNDVYSIHDMNCLVMGNWAGLAAIMAALSPINHLVAKGYSYNSLAKRNVSTCKFNKH